MKKVLKFLFGRLALVGAAILAQGVFLIAIITIFSENFIYVFSFCEILSMLAVLYIVNSKSNPGYKIAWIIPILIAPIFGGVFYIMLGGNKLSNRTKRKLSVVSRKMSMALDGSGVKLEEIAAQDESAANQSRYIQNYAYCPAYKNTKTEYLAIGEMKFEKLVEELKKAQHYIFLEYFIIEEGKMWDCILKILARKAQSGLDVRVIYDDMGCIRTLPYNYNKKLENMGIKCCIFNPFIPVMSSRLNNRDHRKIAVIDGHTGFTGGINLADEYINAYEKYGHWKDTSIMLKGDAVWSLTVMFLSMWGYLRGTNENYDQYKPSQTLEFESDGYVQPFADSPLDNESVGENVYLNIITKAKRYVYINTPYLIVDNEMVTALSNAAKSGVDVRIVTPHIPDKPFVHAVTRAYYEIILKSGVKIYEYTPGFMHAKTFAADDEYGVVGTINMDYRSLYLHFECGVWMYNTKSVIDVKNDFLKTLGVCQAISLCECQNIGLIKRLARSVLRVFAPLM